MKINNLTSSKIFGWALLLAGVALIGWTLLNSYNIFTGKVEPPQILKAETKAEGGPIRSGVPTGETDIQKQMESLFRIS